MTYLFCVDCPHDKDEHSLSNGKCAGEISGTGPSDNTDVYSFPCYCNGYNEGWERDAETPKNRKRAKITPKEGELMAKQTFKGLDLHDVEKDYLDAAQALADARVRYADQFTAARFTLGEKGTDGRATQIAIAVTGDEITVLTAKLAIAAHRADMYTPYMTIVKEGK